MLTALAMRGECRLIAEVGDDPDDCYVHLRCASRNWQLVWRYVDSLNYTVARVSKNADQADDISGWSTTVQLENVRDGKADIIARQQFSSDSPDFSLLLIHRGPVARLYCADGQEIFDGNVAVPTPLVSGSEIRYEILAGKPMAEPSIIAADIGSYPVPINSQFTSADSLYAYLRASSDPAEGVYSYLDRDFAGNEIKLGGRYRIAVVLSPQSPRNGSYNTKTKVYDIIYLEGAEDHRTLWSPLSIKGRLTSTNFINNYDCTWYDSTRAPLGSDREVNASIANGILTINLPLYNSSLRFGIVPKSQL